MSYQKIKVYSFLFATFLSIVAWKVSFMPINHWTASVLILAGAFIWWDVLKLRAQNRLALKSVFKDVSVLFVAIILILLSSRVIV